MKTSEELSMAREVAKQTTWPTSSASSIHLRRACRWGGWVVVVVGWGGSVCVVVERCACVARRGLLRRV